MTGNPNRVKNIQNLRTLCTDIVEKAKSGHPGAPLGLSDFVYILFTEFIKEEDIFILSNGHACALQYAINYLRGILTIDDIKNFRQIKSKTPGHPEKENPGIEITTGPLGQGVANAVGFALSIRLSNLKNINENNSIQNRRITSVQKVYCIFGDGCYQEGISQEAFSLLSILHKKYDLSNITFIYDFNKVTIDGSTELSMNEDVVKRFQSLYFEVIEIQLENNSTKDDEDSVYHDKIRSALEKVSNRPRIIILHTKIGKDTSLENSCKAHGAPIGEIEVEKLKKLYGIPNEEFYVSEELKSAFKIKFTKNHRKDSISANYTNNYKSTQDATRKHFSNALNDISVSKPILCGCADLLPSVLCKKDNSEYIHFGIREHSMFAVMNAVGAHGKFIPICGTFFNFITYGFPAVRLSSIDGNHIIYVLTHDSIGLGEDGPTHQPIEAMCLIRATPGLITMRPCDGLETRIALKTALEEDGPVCVVLSRQTVSEVNFSNDSSDINKNIWKGAHFVTFNPNSDIIILATGSEVSTSISAGIILKNKCNLIVSVISLWSFEIFDRQSGEYKNEILNQKKKSGEKSFYVSVEALSTFGWCKYADFSIGIDRFGMSGPGKELFDYFGFTPEKISERIKLQIDCNK